MKNLITLFQVAFWVIVDLLLFAYYLKWNQYMNKPTWNGFMKLQNGIVRRAYNSEKHFVQFDNKYTAAFNR